MLKRVSYVGLISLVTVWIVWGSTYLAIRVAVREGSGFPPFEMAALRALFGGVVLLLIAKVVGWRVRPSRREGLLLAICAVLLWNGGNGLVTWAEHRMESGFAALCVGSTPIFSAIVEGVWDRRRPSLRLTASLLLGFAGLAVLAVPVLRTGMRADFLATLALVVAPACWSVGSSVQQRYPVALHPVVSAGWLQLFGVVGFTVLFLACGEPMPHPTPTAWLAWAYLAVVGSLVGFTAYVVAVKHLAMPVVMTYAYVNPVIAVGLGWLLLDEPVTKWTAGGTALILLGVAGVFHEKFARGKVEVAPKVEQVA